MAARAPKAASAGVSNAGTARRGVGEGGARRSSPAMASNPWDPLQPTAAGVMLARCLSTGVVSQRTLDICGKPSPCFAYFSEAEQITNLQAEISQIKLETEALQMEQDTADIIHPFYLTQKCQALQAMNKHLDAVLKNKRALRQRLLKPFCRESLPVEASFHRYVVELLALAVAFIEKLETHILTVRSMPQIPENIKNMSSALAKMDLLVTETEELAEQILEWREKQKGIFENSQLIAGLDSSFKSIPIQECSIARQWHKDGGTLPFPTEKPWTLLFLTGFPLGNALIVYYIVLYAWEISYCSNNGLMTI